MEATSSRIIEVPLYGTDNVLEIDCNELPEQAQEICDILFQEKSPPKFYLQFALEYFRQNKIDESIVALKKGLSSDVAMNNQAKLPLVNCLASMYINKAKASPIPPAVADQADGRPHGTAANGYGSTATTANDRDKYFELAYALLDESGRMDPSHPTTLLCKGLLLLAKRQFDQAGPLFDRILGQNSNDVAALLGKARVHYAKKQYPMALDIYQHVLTLRPYSKPDVRVGIGLCFQKLGMRDKARRAFLRAIELDPQNIGARVLLATSLLNSARDALLSGENPEDAASEGEGLVRSAMQQLQEAYMARPHHATLLLLLSDRFFYRDELDKAKAVAQEAVAMADTPAFQAEAYYQVGRCAHKLGQYDQAYEMYSAVLGLNPRHVRARFGFGQMEIHKGLWASAVSTIESLLERFPQCVEIMQALGYIHSQLPKQEGQALEFYERAIKCVADDIKSVPAQPDSSKQQPEKHEMPFSGLLDAASQGLVTDPDFFLEAAALFEPTNITKSYQSYRIAERILERQGKDQSPIPELHNNIGALACLQDSVGDAYTKLSRAVESCRALLLKFEGRDDRADKENPPPVSFANLTRDQKRLESTLTTSMYNLARLYECIGKWTEAEDLYKRILSRHSHYIDAHLRIAYMEQGIHRRVQDAVDAYNDALSLDTSRIATRLLLGNLQLETKQVQAGRRTFEYVLKQLHKHDIYSLCSLGNFYLSAGRSELSQLSVFIAAHGATVSDKKIQHQQKKYQSLAKEHYSKAITFFTTCLKVDEKCVAAAQGLAVAMAENGKFAESRDLLIQVREAIMKGTSAPSITEAQRHLHQLPHMARQIDVNMHVKKDRVLWATLDLAHVYTELGQFRSAVLMYEACLKRLDDSSVLPDHQIREINSLLEASTTESNVVASERDQDLIRAVTKREREERLRIRKEVDICLARTLYVQAKAEKNVDLMKQALARLKEGLELYKTHLPPGKASEGQPKSNDHYMHEIFDGNDSLVMFNLALVGQALATIVSELPQENQTLQQIDDAIADLEESTGLFQQLADAKNTAKNIMQKFSAPTGDDKQQMKAPQIRFNYDPTMAAQRAAFGKSLLSVLRRKRETQVEFERHRAAQREESQRRREAEREQAELKRQEEERARREEEARLAKIVEERNAQIREEMAAQAAAEAEMAEQLAAAKSAAKHHREPPSNDEEEPQDASDVGETERAPKRRPKRSKRRKPAVVEMGDTSASMYEADAVPVGSGRPESSRHTRKNTSSELAEYDRHGKKYKSKAIISSSDEESSHDDGSGVADATIAEIPAHDTHNDHDDDAESLFD